MLGYKAVPPELQIARADVLLEEGAAWAFHVLYDQGTVTAEAWTSVNSLLQGDSLLPLHRQEGPGHSLLGKTRLF